MTPLLAPQILLSLTLLVSGIAKLGAREGTRDAMRSLRLPLVPAHGVIASVLPVAEIVLALLAWVPVPPLQVVVGILILALMLAYLVIIARALTFPEPVACSCFGTLASPTVSRATLWRNIVLSVLAVIALVAAVTGAPALAVLWAPGSVLGWALALATAVVLTALALGGTTAGAADGRTDRRADGRTTEAVAAVPAASEPGAEVPAEASDAEELDYERSPIPFGVLREQDGTVRTLRALTADGAVLLVWLNPGCGPCERVMDNMGAWREAFGPHLQTRALIPGGVQRASEAVRDRVGPVAEDIEYNLAESLGGGGNPSAVLLGADGMLAGGPVTGSTDVIEFAEEIAAQLAEAREAGQLPEPGAAERADGEMGPVPSADTAADH